MTKTPPATTTIDNVAIDVANYYAEPDFDPSYKQSLAKQMHEQRVRAWFLEELFFAYNNGYAHGKADATEERSEEDGKTQHAAAERGDTEGPTRIELGSHSALDDLPAGTIVEDDDGDLGIKLGDPEKDAWLITGYEGSVGGLNFAYPVTIVRRGKAETSPGPRVIGVYVGLDDLPSGSIVVDADDDIGVKQARNIWHVRHDVCVGNMWFSTPITVLREGGLDA